MKFAHFTGFKLKRGFSCLRKLVVCERLLEIIDIRQINLPEICLVMSCLRDVIKWFAALNGIDVY